jgi:hypothetical protein
MWVKRGLVVALLMVVAACSHGHSKEVRPGLLPPTPQQRAVGLCTSALRERPFSAEATTVGGLRTTTIGTRGPTQVTMFPQFKGSDFAAWCWVGRGSSLCPPLGTRACGGYDVYEVTPDEKAHEVVSGYTVPPADAHGAPAVP